MSIIHRCYANKKITAVLKYICFRLIKYLEHKCTKDGHECLSTFTYQGVTYKDECAPLIEDRTWCMYKQPKEGENLTQGTHYDECTEKCKGQLFLTF